ncbi:probable carboxylesterase 8 [Salvia miltiorrhiza]|uniref:probable carboxylesterase 8 n=1 Tax=Salvia miltiorrhiza TaxID=226208 RepID=UPI0025AD2F85|nr:probable carboxylesterase 8 [Salvia miltiorrhiza]
MEKSENNTQNMMPQIPSVEEAYKFFKIELNPDGSLTRHAEAPTLPASPEPDPNNPNSSLSKDIPLNAATGTFIRLFRPRSPPPNAKLPLLIYYHGGGFVFLSATSAPFHASCGRMSAHLPALIASVEYRLAPEHRLPAAYHDAIDAVEWARDQAAAGAAAADPWMGELADFSRVFLMGSSAGGNIVYRTGLTLLDRDVRPMKIVGLIMNQPFFGGVRRTGSELAYYNDKIIPLHGADLLWSLALPEGAGRDHEYCDPLAGGGPGEERLRRLPLILVRGYSGDPLVDKQKEFVEMLAARGARVVAQFVDGGFHGVELFDPKFADALYDAIRDFVAADDRDRGN